MVVGDKTGPRPHCGTHAQPQPLGRIRLPAREDNSGDDGCAQALPQPLQWGTSRPITADVTEHALEHRSSPAPFEPTLVGVARRAGVRSSGPVRVVADVGRQRNGGRLHESEAVLEHAYALAKLGGIAFDVAGRRVHCSREAARILGEDDAFTCTIDEFRARFVEVGEQERWAAHVESACRRGGTFSFEHRANRRSGEPLVVRVRGRFDVDSSGVASEATAVLQDVTERRLLEERVQQQQKMEAVGQLASGIAHDFNNLLLVIGGNAQLALAAGAADASEELAEIVRASERAGALVRQLLAFSRVEPPAQRHVEVNDVVCELRTMLDRLLERTIEIRTELTDGDTTVFADPGRLEQALLNLALNARDAMPRGGTLTISTAIAVGSIVLRVADTGEGMDAETRQRSFEPFFTTKGAGKGTGLGLPAVCAAVSESGGAIDVESAPGRGTTFTIELPRATDEPHPSDPGAPGTVAPGAGERILIVEDDPMVRAVSTELLTRAGYTIEAVETGEDALQRFDEGAAFDVLVTDLMMPRMTGPELTAALRERGVELPTVYMSGYPDDDSVPADGARTRFLAKPFSGERVAAAVGDLLRSSTRLALAPPPLERRDLSVAAPGGNGGAASAQPRRAADDYAGGMLFRERIAVNLTVKRKLFGAFAGIVALAVALGIVAVTMIGSVHRSAVTVGQNGVAAETSLAAAGQVMNKLRKDQIHYFIAARSRAGVAGDISGDLKSMATVFRTFSGSTARERQGLVRFEAAWNAYVAASHPMFALVAQGRTRAAETLIGDGGTADHLWDRIKSALVSWQSTTTAAVSAELANAQSTYSTARLVVGVLVALTALLGAGLAFGIGRVLTRSISQLLRAADGIAEGDVDQTVTIASRDELGRLGASFTRMIDHLRCSAETAERIANGDLTVEVVPCSERDALGTSLARMVANLRSVLSRVSEASTGMSSASQQMAATSAEAGRAVNEIARAVGDVALGAERQARMVESARNSSEDTAHAAGEAREVSQEGVLAANSASEAMASVRSASESVSSAIAHLAEKSEQIGGIVETITGIAGQTNLLALNAAIEAARAGEQGRGFAVVAEEVRKLAEESQHAAASIAQLIAEIQLETAVVVETVEDGARRSAEGVAVVEQAREAFLRIGSAVEGVTSRVGEIASAVGEVATVAEQSSASAEQVSASTQQTSASTQQIASSAQALAATAEELEQLVSQFQFA